jgi:hypothetical protein
MGQLKQQRRTASTRVAANQPRRIVIIKNGRIVRQPRKAPCSLASGRQRTAVS